MFFLIGDKHSTAGRFRVHLLAHVAILLVILGRSPCSGLTGPELYLLCQHC